MTFWSAVRYFHSVTPVRIYFRAAMIGIVLLEVELAIQGSRSDAALVSLLTSRCSPCRRDSADTRPAVTTIRC
jgi:hypothetical protein